MAGYFNRYNDLCNKVPGAYEALIDSIKHGVCISGDCVEWLIHNCYELVVDEIYDDFEDASRWSIGKAYVIALDGKFYCCSQEVGLTEMQPNNWYDQTFQPVHKKEITTTVWELDEEE